MWCGVVGVEGGEGGEGGESETGAVIIPRQLSGSGGDDELLNVNITVEEETGVG